MRLTTKEAAEILEITPRQVSRLCKVGILKGRRHGYMWDIDANSVEVYNAAPKDKGGRPKKMTQNN